MMGYGNFNDYANSAGLWGAGLGTFIGGLLVPLVLWSLVWKGWALWKAARAGSKVWFVVLLVVNTVGVLEILYIFLFSKSNVFSGGKTTKKSRK
jgi:hypothetical protein